MEKARLLLIEKLTEATGNAVPTDEEERFAFFGKGWLHQLFCKFKHCQNWDFFGTIFGLFWDFLLHSEKILAGSEPPPLLGNARIYRPIGTGTRP